MHKFDLYVTSVPNNNAKLIIARHIAALNHSIPLQTAMKMAEKPPLLLFRGLELKEAEQHVARLKRSGIGFKVVEAQVTPEEESGEIYQKPATANEQPTNYEETADSHKSTIPFQKSDNVQNPAPAQKIIAGNNEATINHQKSIDAQESTKASQSNIGDKKQTGESTITHQKNVDTQGLTKISQNKEDDKDSKDERKKSDKKPISRDDKKQSDKEPASDDGKKQPDKKPESANDKKRPDEKSSARQNTKSTQAKFQSGVRIGSLERAERSEKKSSRKQTIIVMSVFITIAAVLFLLPREKNFSVQSSDSQTQINTKQQKSTNRGQGKRDSKNAPQRAAAAENSTSQSGARGEVTTEQRRQANAYVDSARTLGSDPESVVKFYKIAISFNQQNLAAWQGLLQAYRDLGREADVRGTEEQMRRIFGERIESIDLIVKPFGELIDTYINDDGTYRVEYKSNKRSKDDIKRDVFLLTRAVRTACSCENISIFASTGTGRGLLSHSGPNTSVHSLSAFSKQAQIIWLD